MVRKGGGGERVRKQGRKATRSNKRVGEPDGKERKRCTVLGARTGVGE